MKKRTIALVMAAVMLFGVAIGGTIAWLTAKTEKVVNTFTVGDINITLTESQSDDNADNNVNTNNYKMIPGATIDKNPTVTVEAGSEACYVFVKIEESTGFDDYITYTVENGWTELTTGSNIWWREQAALTNTGAQDVEFTVIGNKGVDGQGTFIPNKVLVNTSVTKTMMNAFDADNDGVISTAEAVNLPKLTFTAYAIQSANLTDQNADSTVDALDAWTLIPKS